MDNEAPKPERRVRVLLVDDEERVRRALAELLRSYPDIDVVGEAASGLEAIALTKQRDPDVVLMDCRMASKTGIEATREIKGQRQPPRVVILTMHPDAEPDARKAGADDFLLKGCSHDLLLGALAGASVDRPGTAKSKPMPGRRVETAELPLSQSVRGRRDRGPVVRRTDPPVAFRPERTDNRKALS